MPERENNDNVEEDDRDDNDDNEGSSDKYDANANLDQEKIERLNAKEDPNVGAD